MLARRININLLTPSLKIEVIPYRPSYLVLDNHWQHHPTRKLQYYVKKGIFKLLVIRVGIVCVYLVVDICERSHEIKEVCDVVSTYQTRPCYGYIY
jgi:hypothetical protein